MKFSYKQLQTYFDEPLPSPEQLADAFTFHAFEIEGVEKTNDDVIMDIKVLPDRASYAKSYEGIALEISTVMQVKRKDSSRIPITSTREISVTVDVINEVLGSEISKEEMITILNRMEITVQENGADLILAVPDFRTDIQTWRDVPEEIGRIYGYDNIKAILPKNTTFKPQVEKMFYYSEKVKN
nr:hypothetical protein [bacterium]